MSHYSISRKTNGIYTFNLCIVEKYLIFSYTLTSWQIKALLVLMSEGWTDCITSVNQIINVKRNLHNKKDRISSQWEKFNSLRFQISISSQIQHIALKISIFHFSIYSHSIVKFNIIYYSIQKMLTHFAKFYFLLGKRLGKICFSNLKKFFSFSIFLISFKR
jgi:hypothetical protein